MNFYYKIRDKNSGLFKNDDFRTRTNWFGTQNPTDAQKYGFDKIGKLWTSKEELKIFLNKFSSWPKTIKNAKRTNTMNPIPANWEIIVYELIDTDSLSVLEFKNL